MRQRTLSILIAGDVHGFFAGFQDASARHAPDLVLQCGDFGYRPDLDMFPPERGFRDKQGRIVPVHFCDGNHDDCKSLRRLVGAKLKACEIAPGVFYQPRGSVLELPGGFTILFAGGAANVDKVARTGHNGRLPEEILSEKDFAAFPDLPSVDMVISHAAPACVALPPGLIAPDCPDPSRAVLDRVLRRYKPRLWFCGHYHQRLSAELSGCAFHALDCAVDEWDKAQQAGLMLFKVP